MSNLNTGSTGFSQTNPMLDLNKLQNPCNNKICVIYVFNL